MKYLYNYQLILKSLWSHNAVLFRNESIRCMMGWLWGVPVRWEALVSLLEGAYRYISTLLSSWTREWVQLPRPSLSSHFRERLAASPCAHCPTEPIGQLGGMHSSSTSTTPFSVKDILKLEHHNDYENDLLMTSQVFPMNYQHVHGASRSSDQDYDCQEMPCVSEVQEKLDTHNSAAEEEINEHGEISAW